MIRLIYIVLFMFPVTVYYLLWSGHVAKHQERYSEQDRYRLAQRMIAIIKRRGRIYTDVYGIENLPEEGGYVMYPNHQGRYDALGIIAAHQSPCTFLIDKVRAGKPFVKQVGELLDASHLDKTDPRSQVSTIMKIADQVKKGRRYIVFPEGKYGDNGNNVQEFLPGAFKCSIRSQAPIVPVALIDSYKVFGVNSLKKIRTEVHFLQPLYYEEYHKMNSAQIAQMVKTQIRSVIQERSQRFA